MNTPVHITLALATLGKKDSPKRNRWVIAGALIPDLAMFGLFFYELLIRTPQSVIWNEKYYSPLWQNTVDIFNSLPLCLALYLVALQRRWVHVQVLCLALLLHIATDLPLHHNDGHRHFFPFSNWRFESPISYWDPNYYGHLWFPFETILLLVTSYIAWHLLSSRIAKILLISIVVFSIVLPMSFYLFL